LSIFQKPPTKRLQAWHDFRQQLETVEDPLSTVAKIYAGAPRVKVYSDPYDQSTWPTPWELIEENEYCPLNQVLGVAYTLGLTDRFKYWKPKIAIEVDNSNKCVYYLLYHDDKVYGYEDNQWIPIKSLPKTLIAKKIYCIDGLH
jgi:hypothetical protein